MPVELQQRNHSLGEVAIHEPLPGECNESGAVDLLLKAMGKTIRTKPERKATKNPTGLRL